MSLAMGCDAGAVLGRSSAQALGRRVLLAAREGRVSELRELMSLGAPFACDWVGNSALHCAAMNGHVDACRLLLRTGVSRDARTKVERTPLHLSASEGHVSAVELLLEFGARADLQDMLGMTPLHWAAERGHREVVIALLGAGAKQMIDRWGRSPADIAAEHLADLFSEKPVTSRITKPMTPQPASPLPASPRSESPPLDTHESPPAQRLAETNKANASQASNGEGAEALLRAHGITLIPKDKGNTVLSALSSGRTVQLSEAGKVVLREAKVKASPPQSRCVVVPSAFLTNNDPQWLRTQLLAAHAQLAQIKRKNARLNARLKACRCQTIILDQT